MSVCLFVHFFFKREGDRKEISRKGKEGKERRGEENKILKNRTEKEKERKHHNSMLAKLFKSLNCLPYVYKQYSEKTSNE